MKFTNIGLIILGLYFNLQNFVNQIFFITNDLLSIHYP